LSSTYIALDLETTGLDLENDAIIEIGAVRFDEGGTVLETYETLVNPGRPLPPVVADLTGISEREVASAPPVYLIASQLQAFLGDAPLVGHNVIGFDSVFLARAGIITSPDLYDTQYIASLLLPGLPEYSLGALAEGLGIGFPYATGRWRTRRRRGSYFLALRERGRGLPSDVLAQVAQWMAQTDYPGAGFHPPVGFCVSCRGGPPQAGGTEPSAAAAPVKTSGRSSRGGAVGPGVRGEPAGPLPGL
jgi:hypothetical protein